MDVPKNMDTMSIQYMEKSFVLYTYLSVIDRLALLEISFEANLHRSEQSLSRQITERVQCSKQSSLSSEKLETHK